MAKEKKDVLNDDEIFGSTKKAEIKDPLPEWYKRGVDPTKMIDEIKQIQDSDRERIASKFWLKEGTSAKIVFVDTYPFGMWMHNYVDTGKYKKDFPCRKDVINGAIKWQDCPLCVKLGERHSQFYLFYTVIDTRPYTKKSGEQVPFSKVLYKTKDFGVREMLKEVLEKDGTLAGAVFEVKRFNKQESNTGSYLKFLGRIDITNKYGADFANPIDYVKVLAPITDDEAAAYGFNSNIVGSSSDTKDALDEQVPF